MEFEYIFIPLVMFEKIKLLKSTFIQEYNKNIKPNFEMILINISIILIFILLNSFFLCFFFNRLLTYNETIYPLNFLFSKNIGEKYLISEIINCNNKISKFNRNCLNLKEISYDIVLDLSFANTLNKVSTENFEINIYITDLSNYIIDTSKIVFFEENEYLVNFFLNIIKFPFRIFGFLNYRKMNFEIANNYINLFNEKIKKIQIIIKNNLLNIINARIIFFPSNTNIIFKTYYRFKTIFLIILFFILFFIKILFFSIFYFLKEKIYLIIKNKYLSKMKKTIN